MIYPVDMAVIMLQLFGVVIESPFNVESRCLYISLYFAPSVWRLNREN